MSGDLVQRQHHVLEQAYDSLTPARRKLLGAHRLLPQAR